MSKVRKKKESKQPIIKDDFLAGDLPTQLLKVGLELLSLALRIEETPIKTKMKSDMGLSKNTTWTWMALEPKLQQKGGDTIVAKAKKGAAKKKAK